MCHPSAEMGKTFLSFYCTHHYCSAEEQKPVLSKTTRSVLYSKFLVITPLHYSRDPTICYNSPNINTILKKWLMTYHNSSCSCSVFTTSPAFSNVGTTCFFTYLKVKDRKVPVFFLYYYWKLFLYYQPISIVAYKENTIPSVINVEINRVTCCSLKSQ